MHARFAVAVVYMGLHTVMQYWDLYDCLDDFDTTVINVMETMLTSATYASLIIVRRNKQLDGAIVEVKRYIASVSLLEDMEEKRMYHRYNNVAYQFGKYGVIVTCSTAIIMYVRPLIGVLHGQPGQDNGTVSYQLPFRAHIIFDYTADARIYSLLYLYQFPVTFVAMFHAAEVSFIVSLVLHFCGRLSILSYRIRNISSESRESFNDGIKEAVTTHFELTQSLRSLNDTLSVILLIELLGCCSRLGLAMFVVLIKLDTDLVAAINFSLYSVDQIAWLYLYSYIGEQTSFESQRVGDAYYEIDWPAVESNDRKALLICIVNGYKALYITAGKIYTFSLFGFTSIMKTSMACLSVLQATM